LIKVEDAKLYVKFNGACVGCSSKSTTLQFVVEKEIRSKIHPDIKIVEI